LFEAIAALRINVAIVQSNLIEDEETALRFPHNVSRALELKVPT